MGSLSLLSPLVQASVWTVPACTCCIGPLLKLPGMTSQLRWHWSSPTCMRASRSHTSPGQYPPPPASSVSHLPVCIVTPHSRPSQVLALVYHQDLCGGPGTEGLGAAAAAQSEPHRAAEAPGPRAGSAAVPAQEQGGAARGQWGGLKAGVGTGLRALSPVGAPAGGCHPAAAAGALPWPRALRHCGDV